VAPVEGFEVAAAVSLFDAPLSLFDAPLSLFDAPLSLFDDPSLFGVLLSVVGALVSDVAPSAVFPDAFVDEGSDFPFWA
jgi:hypothetical protein